MERTPSPSRRLRTPPAPMLGPQYDSYEPYSPRRSSRVAAKSHLHQEQTTTTPASSSRLRTARNVTPTASSKKAPTSHSHPHPHTLSPPSSPHSPAKSRSPRSPRSTRRAQPQPQDLQPSKSAIDSDSDIAAPTPATRRFLSSMPPQGSLLTPAKTPRKRQLKPQEAMRPTARILFATNRPATVEEAIPTPRKNRRTMNAFTLESFAEQMDDGSGKIDIYTDSKERVPTLDEDEEDNPFITKKGKGKAKAAPQKRRAMDPRTKELFEAAARGEGMVFSLKGKKILRKFHDGPPSDASDGEHQNYEQEDLLRQSGTSTYGRITRSSIKPRVLFKEEIARQKRENGEEDDDEEAPTDIDEPVATPSRRTATASASFSQDVTPPPTTKRAKSQMSFDSWSRVKSASRSDSASRGASRETKKRSGPTLESGVDKRARSERTR